MKFRLTRLDQIYTESEFYFITFGTYERRPLLANQQIHEAFRNFAAAAAERNVFAGRYVIMPDHIHLFAAFGDETPLSSWMKSLKNYLSKALRGMQVKAPHWQKGYFDHLLRSDESYGSKWEYVEQNPVRTGLVANSSEWAFQGEINPITF